MFALSLVALVVGAGFLALLSLRYLQQKHVMTTFQSYLAAPRQAVTLHEENLGSEVELRMVGSVPNLAGNPVNLDERKRYAAYFIATVDQDACAGAFEITTVYRATDPAFDPSRSLVVSSRRDTQPRSDTDVLFPVFTFYAAEFVGFRIPSMQRKCLKAIEAVSDFRSLSLPLWITLAPGWQNEPLYQTLTAPPWPF